MRFSVAHRTSYAYTAPAQYTVQTLRLTPRTEPHQRVLRWQLAAPGAPAESIDAFGNIAHLLTLNVPHESLSIEARGVIEVDALRDGRLVDDGTLPVLTYAAVTALTRAEEDVREFAARWLRGQSSTALLDFANAICDAVEYETGTTHVASTAAQALRLKRGVCQDHAHLFIAGCRAHGIAARYVSGYTHDGTATQSATHAWVDAWIDGSGWTSIDVTHRQLASDSLCRLAIGRDYDSAGPVRGMRVGGGEESMTVRVSIRPES